MSLRVLLLAILVSLGWVFAPPVAEEQCQATADCNACGGPCCGSSGCTWVPRSGAGPNATCAGGNRLWLLGTPPIGVGTVSVRVARCCRYAASPALSEAARG